MTPNDRYRVSRAAARYLDALDRDDADALAALWAEAANDSDLQAAFRDIHAGTQHIYVDNNTLTAYTQARLAELG